MSDIVKRLRDLDTATCEDAAAEIERLRAQVRKSALDYLAADGQAADLMGEVSKLRAALWEIAKHSRGGVIDTTEKMDRDEFIGIARAALGDSKEVDWGMPAGKEEW